MKRYESSAQVRRTRLLAGVCYAALFLNAAPAFAQAATQDPQSPAIADQPPTDPTGLQETAADDDIIVKGIRQNIESAQARKRNADTVVDSITAEDIGSFPDKSVAEALQRVAGVTVSRFSGSDDTSHFSAEPSSVLIRGLNQVRSEFNGRDTFSANSNRGLSYSDISPELLGGVDTYKNQTAELIEGGIAGSINLRTRLPFDSDKRIISLSADVSYGDISEKFTPSFSGIYADVFDTGMGKFGFMINGAYSQVKTASQGIQFDRMGIFDGVYGPGLQYIPSGIFVRDNLYDRKRYGISGAVQWESNDGDKAVSIQYNRSQYNNSWEEHSVYTSAFATFGLPTDFRYTDPTVVAPRTGTPDFTFDSEGNFLTGSWSSASPYVGEAPLYGAPIAVNAAGQPFFQQCYAWEGCTAENGNATRRGPQLDAASNALTNKEYTQDISANFRWNVTDKFSVRVDGQYVKAEVKNYNAAVNARTFANAAIDLTGRYPSITIDPDNADLVNLSPGGISNPNNYSYYSASDHTEDSAGEEYALRLDADYELDSDWLDSLRMGVRYSDRDQTVRWGAYNWQNIANTWAANASYYNIDSPAYPAGNYEAAGLPQGFFGGNQVINQDQFVFFDMEKLSNLDSFAAALGRPVTGVGEWNPVCSGAGLRIDELPRGRGDFGCYLPSEILKISERTWAGYAMLKFGGGNAEIGGVGISGNVGVRTVWTRDNTAGAFTFAQPFTKDDLQCLRGVDALGRITATAGCVTSADEIAFAGGKLPSTAKADHFHALPSFNLKLDLNDKLVSRLAYSRAISRPDVGLLRNFINVNRISPNLADANNPAIIYAADGVTPVGYNFRYTAQAGNPYLKPIVADQFDATLEYYFNASGSFTATAFYKSFKNYIQSGTYNLPVTNNGVTRNIIVTGPQNGDGAKIKGIELAFTTFFGFLPAPFDGLGIQTNYTYVDNGGVQTTQLISETAAGTAGGGVSFDDSAVKPDALEGISAHSFNLVGMYEKGPISLRAAYNWRSEYLVTAIDCCVGLPIWQKSQGYLDASFRFRLTKRLELSLQGSNLLGTDTVLQQQVDNAGTLKPNAWFKNDRRIQAGVRFTM